MRGGRANPIAALRAAWAGAHAAFSDFGPPLAISSDTRRRRFLHRRLFDRNSARSKRPARLRCRRLASRAERVPAFVIKPELPMRGRDLKALVFAAVMAAVFGAASARAAECGTGAEGFNDWLKSFKQVAINNGVSREVVD